MENIGQLSRSHCFNVHFPSVPQFWAAYVSCNTQFHDAVRATLEQIDVIHRFVEANPDDFKFVTTADGMNISYHVLYVHIML